MAEQHFLFQKSHRPWEVMSALAACAAKHREDASVLGAALQLKFIAPAIAADPPAYQLAVRGFRSGIRADRNDKALAQLFATLKDALNDDTEPIDMRPDAEGYRRVGLELHRLVFHNTPIEEAHLYPHLALIESGHVSVIERLLYLPPAEQEDILRAVEHAKHFLVQHRGAVCSGFTEETKHLKSLFLWLTDDEERYSWYDHNFFPEALVMRVAHFGGTRVGFDGRFCPYQHSIEALIALTQASPQLFGCEPAYDAAEFLWLFVPEADTHTLPGYAGRILFSSDYVHPATASSTNTAPDILYPSLDIVAFASDVAGYEEIKLAAINDGYRLHLRSTRHVAYDDVLLEQLEQERLLLQEEIDTLRELQGTSPRLYRFGQHDIAGLVATLSQYDPQTLQRIKYGFHAPTNAQPSTHYLWIDDDVFSIFFTNLSLWHSKADITEFWLDPRWAQTYRLNSLSAVFVPMGMILGPDFHSWQVETMDDYLRVVADEWYHGKNNVQKLPVRPVFVFEPSVRYSSQDVRLSVLDMDTFKPITDPSIIKWHNDTLQVIYSSGSVKEFIETAADSTRRSAYLEQQRLRLDAQMAELERHKATVMEQVEAHTQAMLEEISWLLDELRARAVSLVAAGKPLNTKIHILQRLSKETEDETTGAIRDTVAAHEEIVKLEAQVDQLVKQSEDVLKQAEERRQGLITSIDEQLHELLHVREAVKNRIAEMIRD